MIERPKFEDWLKNEWAWRHDPTPHKTWAGCASKYEPIIVGLEVDKERLRTCYAKTNAHVCQSLGKALGYPWFKDDQKNFPGADDEAGVCIGDHVAESIADEAAKCIAEQDECHKKTIIHGNQRIAAMEKQLADARAEIAGAFIAAADAIDGCLKHVDYSRSWNEPGGIIVHPMTVDVAEAQKAILSLPPDTARAALEERIKEATIAAEAAALERARLICVDAATVCYKRQKIGHGNACHGCAAQIQNLVTPNQSSALEQVKAQARLNALHTAAELVCDYCGGRAFMSNGKETPRQDKGDSNWWHRTLSPCKAGAIHRHLAKLEQAAGRVK